jgi:PiT family inorganic phosphate transporter
VTLPAAALVGGLAAWAASSSPAGLVIVVVLAIAAGLGFIALARRKPVTRGNVNDDGAPRAGSDATTTPAPVGANER